MARKRKAEPDIAIIDAMTLFWKIGYQNLSTRQIDSEANISRFTLQTSYGGKMPLFLQVLDCYLEMSKEFFAGLGSCTSLEDLAEWFLQRATPFSINDKTCHGCLMMNTIVEFGNNNNQINERAEAYLMLMKNGIVSSLTKIKGTGQIHDSFDIEVYSEVLVNCLIGINIRQRANNQMIAIESTTLACAALIRSWSK